MKQGIDKLYEKTPAKVLHSLATGALARADHREIQDIFEAIGNRSCGEKQAFSFAFLESIIMILAWALDCQMTYRMVFERTVYLANADPSDEEARIKFVQFINDAGQRKFVALIAAMQKICAEGGFEFEPIKRIAGIDEIMERVIGDAPVIQKWVDEYVAQYSAAS